MLVLKCLVEISSISEHLNKSLFNSKILLILCQHNESERISHEQREHGCHITERLVFEIYEEVLQITKKEKQVNRSLGKKCNQAFHKKETVCLFVYLFIFGCVESSLWCAGFSLRWLLLLWSAGSRRVGFSSCGVRA